MIKVFGIAAVCLLLSVYLKSQNKVFSLFITICGALLIFYITSDSAVNVFNKLSQLKNAAGSGSSYVEMMLKILGVSITTQIVCDICRDNGESALASQTEIASKIAVLVMILPLFDTVINIVTGLTK